MHYYIDGYNLLFRLLHAGENLRTQRDALIADLQTKIILLNIDATLVFDSHYQPDQGSLLIRDTLKIVYTPEGETADEYILQELKELQKPAEHIIITSDKKLAWLCRRRLGRTESAEEFMGWLNKRYRNRLRQQIEEANPPQLRSLIQLRTPLLPDPAAVAAEENAVELPKEPAGKKIVTAEECFDYYLGAFEKEAEELLGQANKAKEDVSKKRKSVSKNKKKIALAAPENPLIPDEERWLHAFEARKSDDDTL